MVAKWDISKLFGVFIVITREFKPAYVPKGGSNRQPLQPKAEDGRIQSEQFVRERV